MIQIIPAIDIIGGRCVRLSQGDFSRQSTYPETPSEMASLFADAGLRRIHAVDLDGAREGRPVNLDILRSLSEKGDLDVEWGGGIQTPEDLEAVFASGAGHVILGTVAARNPSFARDALDSFGPEKIILGADVRGRAVATRGWTETTELPIDGLIRLFLPGLREAIVTQIARDGMFTGADVPLYRELMNAFPGVTFTASGGIGSIADIRALEEAGVPRVIVGKALYEKKITLEELAAW